AGTRFLRLLDVAVRCAGAAAVAETEADVTAAAVARRRRHARIALATRVAAAGDVDRAARLHRERAADVERQGEKRWGRKNSQCDSAAQCQGLRCDGGHRDVARDRYGGADDRIEELEVLAGEGWTGEVHHPVHADADRIEALDRVAVGIADRVELIHALPQV